MNLAALNQPARAAQATGLQGTGLRQLLAACGLACVLISLGCNADPNCRRETALMRAEILDIEDKYAVLQSKYESTANRLYEYTGEPIDHTMYGATSNYRDVVLSEEIISEGTILNDDGSYSTLDGSFSSDDIIYETQGQVYPQDSTIIDETPMTQLTAPYIYEGEAIEPIQPSGLPSTEGTVQPRSLPTPRSLPKNNSLPLPGDARNRGIQTEDFELDPSDRSRRSIPALQASATLGKSYSNRNSATSHSTATEIIVNRSVTSGQDINESPGDDGLNLLLQTKDANGQIVLQAGELTVSLIDPKQRQRVGFWRFLPGETELFFVDQGKDSDGILLHLPWDESVPRRARLLAHVQFVTEDGRTLKTSSDVLIKPPTGDYSPVDPTVIDWTQRDERWGDSEDSYVMTELDSPLDDSLQSDERQRAEEAWQQNGTYNRGAKFSQSDDRGHSNKYSDKYSDSNDRSRDSDSARVTEALDNPDQPKWRPVR